ncbi:retron system putative HNH endonuclease [Bacillus cereus]|uniref:retron system putative HNH endonuclease n=1 Tax=Bacillus cereus TaxID=1396 RepID=UPI00119F9D96|nr:retron system putative HNH endonuclease [Bacillus cereus]
MRYFKKQSSPTSFEDWKVSKGRSAAYKNIPIGIKEELRESLAQEQSGICCYCGISLKDNIHIEHFKPQKNFRSRALDYGNLHASCMGKKYIKSEEEELDFCGHSKLDWYDEELLVSPLDPNCESYFRYNFSGSIEDQDHKAAEETIKRLSLNSYLITNQRLAAIDGIMETIDLEDTEDIKSCILYLETPNEEGELSSFSYIIVELLKTLI